MSAQSLFSTLSASAAAAASVLQTQQLQEDPWLGQGQGHWSMSCVTAGASSSTANHTHRERDVFWWMGTTELRDEEQKPFRVVVIDNPSAVQHQQNYYYYYAHPCEGTISAPNCLSVSISGRYGSEVIFTSNRACTNPIESRAKILQSEIKPRIVIFIHRNRRRRSFPLFILLLVSTRAYTGYSYGDVYSEGAAMERGGQ